MTNNIADNPLIPLITKLLNSNLASETGCNNLINVLSLLCIVMILSRNNSQVAQVPNVTSANTNVLQKILSDLTKDGSGGSISPDMLMSLAPLLNNPQLKSKLNPANIAAILSLINGLGSGGKQNTGGDNKPETKSETTPEPPAAAITESSALEMRATVEEIDTKTNHNLNWKNNNFRTP